MFVNRLNKNLKHLQRWRKREHIHAYRLYDADIPEYAVAIDVYEGEQRWLHVQEYESPASVNPDKARARLDSIMAVLPQLLQTKREHLFLKVRRQQKGSAQYEKLAGKNKFHQVIEAGNRFLVNFEDYLDTGLFLDHRITRNMLAELAHGKDFLNLFAYTGSASVHAARGGARSTTTVDMSKTYLQWAKKNMALNRYTGPQHQFIQADCLEWLGRAASKQQKFALIFLDPPSFSSSRRMQGTLDIQRDHAGLILNASRLLEPGGTLIFSNNLRHFKMDRQALATLQIKDISRATLPKDFERNPRIHNCWEIERMIS